MKRGLIVTALHLAIVLSLVGKYAWDRERLPRGWAKSINYDPNLPIRGRYVRLWPAVETPPLDGSKYDGAQRVQLYVEDGKLKGRFVASGGVRVWIRNRETVVRDTLAFFIPEHVPDPSRRDVGEELWVELSVPPDDLPRPVRLGVKKDGVLTPLALR